MVLRIFMSPQSRKIYTIITIHHQFLGWLRHHTIVLGTLEIPTYPLHCIIMWCLSIMGKICTLMNIKVNIWSFDWLQIHNNTYKRSTQVRIISPSLRTIIIFPNKCFNLDVSYCWLWIGFKSVRCENRTGNFFWLSSSILVMRHDSIVTIKL